MFQLEKSLKAQIDAWEQEHGKEFLVNGQKFLEYVQQQWEQHHAEKEKEKLERVRYGIAFVKYCFPTDKRALTKILSINSN